MYTGVDFLYMYVGNLAFFRSTLQDCPRNLLMNG